MRRKRSTAFRRLTLLGERRSARRSAVPYPDIAVMGGWLLYLGKAEKREAPGKDNRAQTSHFCASQRAGLLAAKLREYGCKKGV
jgi:hypothetical protein